MTRCGLARSIKLFPLLDTVVEAAKQRVSTTDLNTFLHTATQQHPAPIYRGKAVKFTFLVQISVQPPTFVCFVNRPAGVARTYQRYLENQLRQQFGFAGTPIRLHFRNK